MKRKRRVEMSQIVAKTKRTQKNEQSPHFVTYL